MFKQGEKIEAYNRLNEMVTKYSENNLYEIAKLMKECKVVSKFAFCPGLNVPAGYAMYDFCVYEYDSSPNNNTIIGKFDIVNGRVRRSKPVEILTKTGQVSNAYLEVDCLMKNWGYFQYPVRFSFVVNDCKRTIFCLNNRKEVIEFLNSCAVKRSERSALDYKNMFEITIPPFKCELKDIILKCPRNRDIGVFTVKRVAIYRTDLD